jgi:hypothetical protein
MAPDFGSSPRHIRRRISGYVPVNVTPVTGQKTSKMCNYFLPRPLTSKGVMRIQEALIAVVFGAMIIAAILVGQKPDNRFSPLREWPEKDGFVPDSSAPIWVEPETGMEFVWVKSGCFEMGCLDETWQCNPNEFPVHKVCLDGFWIGKYPVTQKQWLRKFEENPSIFQQNSHHPVENVETGLGPAHDRYLSIIEPYMGGGRFRVIRGGSWRHPSTAAGCSSRYSMAAGHRQNYLGLRIAADLPAPIENEN